MYNQNEILLLIYQPYSENYIHPLSKMLELMRTCIYDKAKHGKVKSYITK